MNYNLIFSYNWASIKFKYTLSEIFFKLLIIVIIVIINITHTFKDKNRIYVYINIYTYK